MKEETEKTGPSRGDVPFSSFLLPPSSFRFFLVFTDWGLLGTIPQPNRRLVPG
jgi:hypothetical protein